MSTQIKLLVVNGALVEAPILNENKRAKNWCAVVDIDPNLPGGLSRRWLNRGRGPCIYIVDQIAIFDVLEFAADHVAWSGNKTPSRWYGVVVAKTDDYLLIEKCKDALTAVVLSKQKRIDPEAARAAINEERQHHLARAKELEIEMSNLGNDKEATREVVDPPRCYSNDSYIQHRTDCTGQCGLSL